MTKAEHNVPEFADAKIFSIDAIPKESAWLLQQASPVVVYGGAHVNADVCVERKEEAIRIGERIAERPYASRVLVQVLRATERLPIESAMDVESLAYANLQSGPEFGQWLATQKAPEIVKDSGEAVLLSRDAGKVTALLNRSQWRNSITIEMRDALIEALTLLQYDNSIEQFHLAAKGDCFSTGGELREFGLMSNVAEAHAIRSQHNPARLMARYSHRISCHIHRLAIGSGIELPAFAEHLSADARTRIQLPELKLGLIPGAGGCVSIPKRIGRQRTAWLVLTGKAITAQTALTWGLIDQIS